MNPQVRLGEDLMSRVSYAALNEDGGARLTSLVRGAVNELCTGLLESAGADSESVLEMVVVGNPIMHHLFLGLDVRPLGEAPFTLATDGPVEIPGFRGGNRPGGRRPDIPSPLHCGACGRRRGGDDPRRASL